MRNLAFISFAVIALAASSGHAEPAAPARVAVHYGDLNLASTQGRKELQRRLTVAAHAVCGTRPDMRSAHFLAFEVCVTGAVGRAMAEAAPRTLADAGR